MHWALAYEVHSKVLKDGPERRADHLRWAGSASTSPAGNATSCSSEEDGTLDVRVAPALQGHHGQLLSILALSRVNADYPMQVEGRQDDHPTT